MVESEQRSFPAGRGPGSGAGSVPDASGDTVQSQPAGRAPSRGPAGGGSGSHCTAWDGRPWWSIKLHGESDAPVDCLKKGQAQGRAQASPCSPRLGLLLPRDTSRPSFLPSTWPPCRAWRHLPSLPAIRDGSANRLPATAEIKPRNMARNRIISKGNLDRCHISSGFYGILCLPRCRLGGLCGALCPSAPAHWWDGLALEGTILCLSYPQILLLRQIPCRFPCL